MLPVTLTGPMVLVRVAPVRVYVPVREEVWGQVRVRMDHVQRAHAVVVQMVQTLAVEAVAVAVEDRNACVWEVAARKACGKT